MRSRIAAALAVAILIAIVAFIAANTYWMDMVVPTPASGEAAHNPFYAAQRFAERLGAATRRERSVVPPSSSGVIVLSLWHWGLSAQREAALKEWVDSGGRLVVDRMLSGNLEEFGSWSGVRWDYNEAMADEFERTHDQGTIDPCGDVQQVPPEPAASLRVCGLDFGFVKASGPTQWALRNATGLQALRVRRGSGSITVLNLAPFTEQSLFEGDHGAVFVAATQLRRGDDVVFITEDDYPSILSLMWTYGAPAIALFGALVVFYLWRGAARFGPAIPAPELLRRSMAEQIRGSGHFALRFGEGAALHTAAVRALVDAALRRIPAYSRLPRPQKATALGKATGMDGGALIAAIDGVSKPRAKELPATLALIESARRQLLNPDTPTPTRHHR